MSKHPRIPWKPADNDDYWILTENGGKVAEVTFPEDRPFVLCAVNAHEALVAALEGAEWGGAYIDHHDHSEDREGACPVCGNLEERDHAPNCQLAAALRAAKEE